jgi:hypothetical protein
MVLAPGIWQRRLIGNKKVSGVRFQVSVEKERKQKVRRCERLAAAKMMNIEYQMSNDECRRMESLAQRRRLRRVSLTLFLK